MWHFRLTRPMPPKKRALNSPGAAWGLAFLLMILLLLSKFKRFKGFVFEAELWEEKQDLLL